MNADDLEALFRLKEKGIISEREFKKRNKNS